MNDLTPEQVAAAGEYFVSITNLVSSARNALPISQDLVMTAASYADGSDKLNVPHDVMLTKMLGAFVSLEMRVADLEAQAGIQPRDADLVD